MNDLPEFAPDVVVKTVTVWCDYVTASGIEHTTEVTYPIYRRMPTVMLESFGMGFVEQHASQGNPEEGEMVVSVDIDVVPLQ